MGEPGGAVTYAAPQVTYVQQDASQAFTYAAPQTLAYPATTAYAQQPVQYVQEPGGAVTYAAPQTVYADPQPVTYYVQGADGQYVPTEMPQVAYQQPLGY